MKEILESKHPNQKNPDPEAFIDCDVLPTLVDVDVTADHVSKVANFLSGSAGVSGLDAAQWQNSEAWRCERKIERSHGFFN